MQRDGNLVVYNTGLAIWASGSNGHANATLIVQDDGNTVIYDGQKAVWHTNTAQPAELVPIVAPTPVPPPSASDRMCCDTELPLGARLTSANGRYFLIFQEDRNLVLYKKSDGKDKPLWASSTNGRVNRCIMQADGNFVLYKDRYPVWASGSNGHTNATILVQDDGNMVIYDGQKAVWHTNTAQPAEPVPVVAPAAPVPPPPMSDRMCCDTELLMGARLTSANGKYFLSFQGDGNLVLYKSVNGKDNPLWASSTNGRANHCFMQADGNFVLYKDRYPVWASGSSGHTNATLIVQEDGNMVIYDGQKAVWHTNTAQPAEPVPVVTPAPVPPPPPTGDRICCDTELPYGARLTSANGRYFLVFQEDGNLVLYRKSRVADRALWASSTNGRVNRCVMQADGNFVLYKDGNAVWISGSNGHTNAMLVVQDDGNMVIYDGQQAVWHTNTAQPERQHQEEQPVVQQPQPTTVIAPVASTACALPDDQYQRAIAAIDGQAFRDNKMMTAKQAVKNKCLSLAQVRGLAKLFSFEDQTLEFVEYAYDFTNEKSEYYTLADIFSFDTNVSAFNKFLSTK
jgi:hypothetical protein